MASDQRKYCGIVFVNGTGSSHAWAATKEEAAQKAARTCKRDWKELFEFKRQHELKVCVIDMRKRDGWYADHRGVFDDKTHELIPYEVMTVTV